MRVDVVLLLWSMSTCPPWRIDHITVCVYLPVIICDKLLPIYILCSNSYARVPFRALRANISARSRETYATRSRHMIGQLTIRFECDRLTQLLTASHNCICLPRTPRDRKFRRESFGVRDRSIDQVFCYRKVLRFATVLRLCK